MFDESQADKVINQIIGQTNDALDSLKQNPQNPTATPGMGPTVNGQAIGALNKEQLVASYNYAGFEEETRLTNLVASDSSDNKNRRAFMQILGPEEGFKDLIRDIQSTIGTSGSNARSLDTSKAEQLLNMFRTTGGYDSFVITSLDMSRRERLQIMKTSGDTFSATGTGKEPSIISIGGVLPNDYSRTETSWLMAFLIGYDSFFRMSKLAKYRLILRFVLPYHTEVVGYVTSVSVVISAQNDNAPQFAISMLVMDRRDLFIGKIPEATGQEDAQTEDVVEGEDAARIAGGLNDDIDTSALLEQEKKLMSTSEYHEYNELRQRIQEGDSLTQEELERYEFFVDKENNMGKEYALYDDMKRDVMQQGKDNGTLPEIYYDDLRDAQERRYKALQSQESLTATEQAEYDSLESKVGPFALYRDISEKQSSGAPLSTYERIKLGELESVIDTGVTDDYYSASANATRFVQDSLDNSSSGVHNDYTTSMGTAVQLAELLKFDPLWIRPAKSGAGEMTSPIYGTKEPLLGNPNLDSERFVQPVTSATTYQWPDIGSVENAEKVEAMLDAVAYQQAMVVLEELRAYYQQMPKWLTIINRNKYVATLAAPSPLYVTAKDVIASMRSMELLYARFDYYKGYIEKSPNAKEVPGMGIEAVKIAKQLDTFTLYTYADYWIPMEPIDRNT